MNRISFDICENFIADMGMPSSERSINDNRNRLSMVKRAVLQVVRDQLTPRQRQIVLLYFFEGKNMPQIARELGVNKSTVSRTMQRALHNLRERLKYYRLR